MEWKFGKNDIILTHLPDSQIMFRLVIVRKCLTLIPLVQDDELTYQYCTQSIHGKGLRISKKCTEMHYVKIGDEKFREFFDLFYLGGDH